MEALLVIVIIVLVGISIFIAYRFGHERGYVRGILDLQDVIDQAIIRYKAEQYDNSSEDSSEND